MSRAEWRSRRVIGPPVPVAPQPDLTLVVPADDVPVAGTDASEPSWIWTTAKAAEQMDVPRNPLKGVQWTLLFGAFVAYVMAITTYRLPIGNAAMIAALAGLALQKGRVRFPPILSWLAAFIGWALVGYSQTKWPEPSWLALSDLMKLWLVLLVAVNALRSRAQIRFFAIAFLAFFALYPLRGAVFNYFIYKEAIEGRALWNYIYNNPNDLAALAILQLSICIGVYLTEPKGWVKKVALLGLGALPFLVLLTQSRGAFIGMSVLILMSLGKQRRKLRSLMFLLIVGGVVVIAAPGGVWQRLSGLKNIGQDDRMANVDKEGSAEQRYEIWKIARAIVAENPVFGVGVGAYSRAHAIMSQKPIFNRFASGFRDTHSTYLNLLAETGIPGFLFWVCMVLSGVIPAERARRRYAKTAPDIAIRIYYLEAGLLAFFTAGIFGSFAKLSFTYLQLAMMVALADLARREAAAAAARPETR